MIEMNIGLDAEGEAATVENRSLRIGKLMTRTARDFPAARDMKVEVIGDLNGGNEPCLYVAFSWQYRHDEAVFDLAAFAKQDCIAVVSNGRGELVGPNAESWGQFNAAFFRRPAIAVAA